MTKLINFSAPWILQAFVIFSIIAFIGEISIFTPLAKSAYNASLSTGMVYVFPYVFGLFFAVALCYKPIRAYHVALLRLMIVGALCGLAETLLTRSPNFYPLQPFLAVILPMIWYGLLNMPSVRQYVTTNQEPNN